MLLMHLIYFKSPRVFDSLVSFSFSLPSHSFQISPCWFSCRRVRSVGVSALQPLRGVPLAARTILQDANSQVRPGLLLPLPVLRPLFCGREVSVCDCVEVTSSFCRVFRFARRETALMIFFVSSMFSSEVFRLNLEQGRFLNSLQTDAV